MSVVGMTSRDKYGFKSMRVGQSRFVPGVKKKHAQMMAATYVRRYPHMVHRNFVWCDVPGGVEVKRVR